MLLSHTHAATCVCSTGFSPQAYIALTLVYFADCLHGLLSAWLDSFDLWDAPRGLPSYVLMFMPPCCFSATFWRWRDSWNNMEQLAWQSQWNNLNPIATNLSRTNVTGLPQGRVKPHHPHGNERLLDWKDRKLTRMTPEPTLATHIVIAIVKKHVLIISCCMCCTMVRQTGKLQHTKCQRYVCTTKRDTNAADFKCTCDYGLSTTGSAQAQWAKGIPRKPGHFQFN